MNSLVRFVGLMLLLMLLGCTASQQVENKFRERVVPATVGSVTALDKFGIRSDLSGLPVFCCFTTKTQLSKRSC